MRRGRVVVNLQECFWSSVAPGAAVEGWFSGIVTADYPRPFKNKTNVGIFGGSDDPNGSNNAMTGKIGWVP